MHPAAPAPAIKRAARAFAGAFGAAGSADPASKLARLAAAAGAEGERCDTHAAGALAIASAGDGAHALYREDGYVCALQGSLYDLPALAHEVGLTQPASAEQALVRAYRRHGAGMLAGLRGDFALLVWDETAGRGLLACDQLGASALFLHSSGGHLLFATELRTLLRALERRPGPDAVAVVHWLSMGGPPPGHTFYEGITQLRGGHFVDLDRRAGWRTERYWKPAYRPPANLSPAEGAERVRERLFQAVQARSQGQATGVMLSGGIDSAAVAGVAAAAGQPPLGAYSAVFPQHPEIDESQPIGLLTAQLGLRGFALPVTHGSVTSGAMDYIRAWEVPATSPNLFFWGELLRRAAADGVTAMLDGEGGDTLFWLSPHLLADRLTRGRALSAWRLARRFPSDAGWVQPAVAARLVRDWGLKGATPYGMHRLRQRLRGAQTFAPAWLTATSAQLRLQTDSTLAWKRWSGPRWWCSLLDAVTGASSTLVHDAARRRNAQAGLRAAHPLLDADLIELVLSLPPEHAFDPRLSRPLLRESVKGLIHEQVRLRPGKSSFDTLFHQLLAGPDLPGARELLLAADAEVGAFVDRDLLRAQLFEQPPPRSPGALQVWALEVWRLLTAELWLRHQAGRPTAQAEAVQSH